MQMDLGGRKREVFLEQLKRLQTEIGGGLTPDRQTRNMQLSIVVAGFMDHLQDVL